ncbi:MAG: sugar phosphate isomerase/epimerase [Candidatus Omnitrophica bacterium]|nr:sugar phosphate isomerase/epimerase [Candidatus Omnitrophota bacterium]
MFSLSTSWNWAKHKNGRDLIEEIRGLGFQSLELGFSLSENMIDDITKISRRNSLKISSVHNFCPVPKGYAADGFLPDTFSLSSLDEHQRKKAVDLTLNSMELAKKVNAGALIIHAGRVDIPSRTKDLIKMYKQGEKNKPGYMEFLSNIKLVREQNKALYISAVKRSLTQLIKRAGVLDLMLCVENRYYSREIPSITEIGEFIEEFSGCKNLGYWHDVGHAQVNDNLGLEKHSAFLERYHQYMVGMHIHDVDGGQDHLAPGTGNFDFTSLKPYLKRNTIKVLEIHQPATAEQIKAAVCYLNDMGLDNN